MEARNQLRREVFNVVLDWMESDWLTEKEVCECLKECISFLWSGNGTKDPVVTRDFCITKMKRANDES